MLLRMMRRTWVFLFSVAAAYFEYRYTHSYDAAGVMMFALFAITEAMETPT